MRIGSTVVLLGVIAAIAAIAACAKSPYTMPSDVGHSGAPLRAPTNSVDAGPRK